MESSEPKKYPPSAKKLRELRKKGQFPKTDLAEPTVSVLFFVLVMFFFITQLFHDFDNWVETVFFVDTAVFYLSIIQTLIYAVILLCLVKIIFFILHWVIINRSTINNQVFSIKFEKLNPVEGFKNNLGFNAISKSFRTVLEIIFLLFLLKYVFDTYGLELNKLHAVNNPSNFIYDLLYFIKSISIIMIIFGVCIGTVDYLFEHFQFTKKNKMTMTEMKNEMKDTEGSPQVKMIRRSKMREIMNEPMTKGRRPTFAIANPTHILVPICFEPKIDLAPVVLDIYKDIMALEHRQYLESLGIPIIEDIALARKIARKMKKNGRTYIDKEFYRDVALIIVALKRRSKIENN